MDILSLTQQECPQVLVNEKDHPNCQKVVCLILYCHAIRARFSDIMSEFFIR